MRAALAVLLVACGATSPPALDAGPGTDGGEPADCLREPGVHRLFVQGHEAAPRPDGTWPFLHDHRLCDDRVFVDDANGDGVWQVGEEPHPLGPAALVHGEHFLVGVGAFVELTYPLCADVAGDVTLYIPNFDEPGSRALHELVVRRGDDEQIIAEATDEEAGQSGYNPFVRVIAGEDPAAAIGDTLVLRSTNLNGVAFSVMVWRPPSEY
ncbi:MAG: hypothetical protein H6719_37405, partial [Sandaracinaceae bacterium]|nr:hypothetical protein [Sandaracinaceae bacterium]